MKTLLGLLMALMAILSISHTVVGQACSATVPRPANNGNNSCNGYNITLSANTGNAPANYDHRWYTTQTGTLAITPTTRGYSQFGGSYYSTYTANFSATTTFWVVGVLNGVESCTRTPITFTLDQATGVSISTGGTQPYNICTGSSTITLTGSGSSSYSWFEGGVQIGSGPTYQPSSNSAGKKTYTLKGATVCGSTPSASIEITYVAQATAPTFPPNQIPPPRCAGTGTTTFYASSTSATGYNWTLTNAGNSSLNTNGGTSTSVIWDPNFSGTATLTLTAYGCANDQKSTSLTYQVKPLPAINSPLTKTICSGASTDYSPTATIAGTTFNWTASAPASVTGLTSPGSGSINQVLNNTGTSDAQVTYVITPTANGCPGPSSSLVVTVKPKPFVSSALFKSILCGQSVAYTPTSATAGTTYTWSASLTQGWISGLSLSGSGNINDILTNTGTTDARVTYVITPTANGCPGPSSSLVVTVRPQPTVRIFSAPTGNGFSMRLTASGTGTSYSWSPATGLSTTTGSTVVASPTVATTYTVTSSDGGACPSQATITVIPDVNYVTTNTLLVDKKADQTPVTDADLPLLSASQLQQSTTFMDGLGRPIQSVTKQGSPGLRDLVQPIAYDAFGREGKKYLPYSDGSNGLFKTDALMPIYTDSKQYLFYQSARITADADVRATDPAPFAQSRFEASPFNRVLEQGSPGKAWQIESAATPADNRTVKIQSRTNRQTSLTSPATGDDNVRVFTYQYNSDPNLFGTVSYSDYYAPGRLSVTQAADEKNYQVLEYKDEEGRVILKRVQFQGTANGSVIPPDSDCMLTYYVYDDLGLLRMVVQPEGVANLPATLDAAFMDKFCFTYHFDARGRMSEKRVPGSGLVYLVYNRRDEVILSQDAVQRVDKKWNFLKYDVLGRAVISGIYTHSHSVDQNQMQGIAEGRLSADGTTAASVTYGLFETHTSTSLANQYYTNGAFPQNNTEILTANYYDDYDLDNNGSNDYNFDLTVSGNVLKPFSFSYAAGKGPADVAKGKPTATRVRELGSTATDPFLLTVTFYDKYGRTIQTHEKNHRGGWQRNLTKPDFAGRTERSELRHNVSISGASSVNVYKTFVYDHAGRLLRVNQQFGTVGNTDPWEKVVEYSYNELGQTKWKKIGNQQVPINGNTFLQQIDYRYNIRGWLTHINDASLGTATGNASSDNDLFGMELLYNEGKNLSNVEIKDLAYAQFNGNIALQKWKTRVDESAVSRQYTYFYDAANRITTANYVRAGQSIPEDFTMGYVAYDRNGNIKRLQQKGLMSYTKNLNATATSGSLTANFGLVDDLTYSYAGNRLTRVDDAVSNEGLAGDFQDKVEQANEYTYDNTGNLKSDANKGIYSIVYNHLNLPTEIWFNSSGSKKIKFTYSAAGVKLKKQVIEGGSDTTWTDYAGGFVYERDKLQFFPTEEGRAINPYFASNPAGSAYTYEYHYKDHLGNLRLSFRDPKPTAYFRATMETTNAAWEDVQFANLATTRVSTGKTFAGSSASALKSASSNDKTLGPFKTLKVKAGDKIVAQVYANYDLPTSGTFTNGVSLATYVGNANNVTGGTESGKNIPLLQLGVSIQPVLNRTSNTLPKAYLRYEYFDESYNYLRSETKPVTIAARGTTWELLKLELGTGNTGALPVDKDGYVQIYVANESNEEVRFDNLEIAYTEAMVVQENHYSPWGLNLAGIEKQGQPDLKFQYNGKEKQEEFGLNWNDYGARFYDPQLGRWHSVDPMTESQEQWNPYHYVYDNPVLRTDPDGRCPDGDCPEFSVAGLLVNTVKDLAVSTINTAAMLTESHPLGMAAQQYLGGDIRASRNENGTIQIGVRPQATTLKEGLLNTVSDVLDVGNVAATVATGGAGGVGLLMAKTGGSVLVNQGVQAAKSSANAVKLNKALATAEQAGEAGEIIAGGASKTPLRKAVDLAAEYGGNAGDYVKKRSSSYKAQDGLRLETHWEENVATGARHNTKVKLNNEQIPVEGQRYKEKLKKIK
jgi:RHS repeat-associated protein